MQLLGERLGKNLEQELATKLRLQFIIMQTMFISLVNIMSYRQNISLDTPIRPTAPSTHGKLQLGSLA